MKVVVLSRIYYCPFNVICYNRLDSKAELNVFGKCRFQVEDSNEGSRCTA